jgi:hypothetical protein
MAESARPQTTEPHTRDGRRRETASNRPEERTDYCAGADGTQHVDTSEAAAPDHSERAAGDDQDIDTAGMIPGNRATDRKNRKKPEGAAPPPKG